MADPQAPPSSSPPTTREPHIEPFHRAKTGGLDPYPPNPGARALMLAPHAVLIVELAFVAALSRGSAMLLALPALLVLSAWAAWLLSRLDARHRPIAIGLGAWAVLTLLGRELDVTMLAPPGPYTGWARAAFHVEEVTRFSTVALPAWIAFATLVPAVGDKGRARSDLWTAALCLCAGAMLACASGYPELRGDALRRVYLGAELGALFVAVVAILSWLRQRGWVSTIAPSTESAIDACERALGRQARLAFEGIAIGAAPRWWTYGTVLALVVGDLMLLGVGAWRYGLFGDAYVVQQAGLLGVWGIVALLQWAALVMARRRA